jgi:hypothetical protein
MEHSDAMNASLPESIAFHLTGERSGNGLDEVGPLGLRPALFTACQDLSKLRYDYPLVLAAGDADGAFVRSLSDIVDAVLQEIAPRGIEGERLRKHVLGLEDEIRALASSGGKGSLLQLWDLAAGNLLSRADDAKRKSLGDSLDRARGVLRFDGEVLDCDEEMPAKFLTHAWRLVQANKARQFDDEVDGLVLKLSGILKADSMKSEDARGAEALKRSIGSTFEEAFDFEALSTVLGISSADGALPQKRRRRIRSALSTLKSQRFFAALDKPTKNGRRPPHVFDFDSCSRALEAFQERLPEMVELIKAMSIAGLEIENRYKEKVHDPFFKRFDEGRLGADDVEMFPTYLVCLANGFDERGEKAALAEVLSSGLPIKVLVQNDDILEDPTIASGQLSLGIRGTQLATMALGLNNAYVLQSGASNLYRMSEAILRGLGGHGPALFNLYSGLAGASPGSAKNVADLPPYLRAAAAVESRAFPVFAYDPAAGPDWASRFSVGGNPQAEAPWPVHRFDYEDEELQKISENVAFTFVDFVAAEARYARHFARVPRKKWHEGMIPVGEFLELETEAMDGKVPYVLMVDADNGLQRVIVDDRLIDAARRCSAMWRSLQELGGIDNSHARRLLEREREIWQQEKAAEIEEARGRPKQEAEPAGLKKDTAPAQEAVETEIAEPAPEVATDEPYIETPRCTTCDECTQINNKMFAYDDNKQAYIADINAGTYRQLVEAAESCQVCIIHPGKPANPNEPNLDELIARAEPFN